ncbi:aldehyde dehydrogenase family protein [Priestia megaterium]|jgi:aldehyde dehydrogenase (NAD+)|uniref:aldehyde dehydrogenase family protein n=1 Tax=Priestia megaterium TaxID=1404 RepID=UPI0023D9DCAA|nr:aldehyde dehydrogenase family protein [Priestia megaterium]MDF2016395.1 aldehyde dehydrogenase family protein [Priestia megaterium]
MQYFERLNKSFINGKWVEGKSSRTYDILEPYDDSVITTVSLATEEQLTETFKIAQTAQKEWAKTSPEQRKNVLQKALEYLKNNHDEIINMIVRESGGTIHKANGELIASCVELEESIQFADKIYNIEEISSSTEGKVNHLYRLPLGVISSITPFNFPMNLGMRTIAPAIALGNSVVHKPDIQTGLTGGQIIAKAFEYAGLPQGVFNSILTDLAEIGDGMITNPIPRLISFTGSTAVGRHIGKIAGENLKRVALELGGNAPFVVLSDADVDRAVDAAIYGKFLHCGQICMIANRIIVQKNHYDEFVTKFTERVKKLKTGDPKDSSTVIGPVINERQADKIMGVIDQAKTDGLRLAVEGKRKGNIISPYVFVDVPNNSTLAQTEIFGPVAQIIPAETDDQAIEFANDTEYGLSAAIFTTDLEKGEKLALNIDAGMTHVNDQTVNAQANAPFGGNKASGLGRFGNPWIMEELTTTKWVSIQEKYRDFPF